MRQKERARTKKLTRQTTKLVKKLLGSQNGKINCAHVFLFFLNCICSYVWLLLLFLFCFLCFLLLWFVFLPLLSIAVCCTLLFLFFTFQTLLQFAISDATRFCFCSDFMLFIFFLLLLLPPFFYILSLCNARRETTIAMHNNIISLISEFSVFFTDQQNETLRRVASWTNRTPPLKFYKWLRFALSFSYKNKHAKSARAALSRSLWEHATRSAVS